MSPIWIAAGVLVAILAQTPPRDVRAAAPAPPAGTASIGGVVVSADAGARPVRLAHVVVIGTATGTLRITATDAAGRFAVAGLPADRYLVGASKLPYLGTMAGARRPARPGAPIALAEGQRLTDVAIRMPLGAAISGVVTDERGEPGANVPIVLQQWRLQNGERALVNAPGATATTDDRGRYRVYGLPPGEYLLAAARTGGQPWRALTDAAVDDALKTGRGGPLSVEPPARYAPVFFPGTPRVSDAMPIVLTAGEDRSNVDVRLELVRTSRVEGTVVTGEGQAVAGAITYLTSTSSNAPSMATTMSTTDGRFAFPTVAPGSYTLFARAPGPAPAAQFATASVEVAGTDMLGVQLTFRPPLSFVARIAFDGTTPAPGLAGRRVALRPLTPLPSGPGPALGAPQITATNATGAFTISGVTPGRYILGSGPTYFGATSDTVTWSLRSVVVDGKDATDLPFEITSERAPKDVVVTYTDQWQQVSGRLSGSSGQAAIDYTVVMFPADKAYWISGSRRIVTTRPGTDGRFLLGGQGPAALPPGQYLLAVVTDIDRDEQFDPAFLASIMPAAVPVALQPGEKKTHDVAIR